MRVVVARQAGGPEVLSVVEQPDPVPGPGELLVRVAAAGVNYIDTYRRGGVYPMPFPHVPGSEGAGVVEAVGALDEAAGGGTVADGAVGRVAGGAVDPAAGFAVGDRVAWQSVPGSYAELVVVPATAAVHVPDGVSLETAAALLLQGLTAHFLVTDCFPVQPGDDVLLHAGAGGVGLLATQLAAARGGRVITTVGDTDKEALSRGAGASDVIRYRELASLTDELPALVRALTGGVGVAAVFDGVGRDTFDASLASLRRRGTLVLFGASSGQVPPFEIQRLNHGGSLFLTRPTLGDYVATRAELVERSAALFAAVADGSLHVRVGARFPLAEAADAHRALQGRATTGKVLLVPRA